MSSAALFWQAAWPVFLAGLAFSCIGLLYGLALTIRRFLLDVFGSSGNMDW